MATKFKKWKRKLEIFLNKRRLYFNIERTKYFYRVVINERFKKYIKWLKYFLTILGLISAFFVFSSVIHAFIFGFGLFLIQTFIEKSLFFYTALYVHPFPKFTIDPERWLGMSFGWAEDPENPDNKIWLAGMVLTDEQYGLGLYSLLMEWNYGSRIDEMNNICLSVIQSPKSKDYTFYLYANPDRDSAKKFFADLAKERRETDDTFMDIQMKHYVQLMLGKTCEVSPESTTNRFFHEYENGQPFHFQLYTAKPPFEKRDAVEVIPGTRSIVKFEIKIRKEGQLTRKDIEFGLDRDWDNLKQNPIAH